MKRFFAAFAAVFVLAQFCTAFSQTEQVYVNGSIVSTLVRLDANFSFEQLIPGLEYSTPVTVSWNVPQQALENLNEPHVILQVAAAPATQDSWIYLMSGNPDYKLLTFQLSCIVQGGQCADGSVLSETFRAYYKAPEGAQLLHQDGLQVNATVETEQQAATQNALGMQINSLQASVDSLNGVDAETIAQLRALVSQARELLAENNFTALQQAISTAEEKLSQAQAASVGAQAGQNTRPNAQANSGQLAATASPVVGEASGLAIASSSSSALLLVGVMAALLIGVALFRRRGKKEKAGYSRIGAEKPAEWGR